MIRPVLIIADVKMYKLYAAIALLLVFHIIGSFGILLSPSPMEFARLSWVSLLVSGFTLFLLHEQWSNKTILSLLIVSFLGLLIEILGVQTGKVFGEYSYGESLGLKVEGVPVIMALNWGMLCYACVYTFSRKIKKFWLVAILSAFTLVLLDWIMEPVAVQLGFWSWETDSIPLNNYLAWFVLSLVFTTLISLSKEESENSVASYLLLIQFAFFGSLRILL